MWYPTPRTVLWTAAGAATFASLVLTDYLFGAPESGTPASPSRAFFALVPGAIAVLVIQTIPFRSLLRRLAASGAVFVGGLLLTVIILFLVGCRFYGDCTK